MSALVRALSPTAIYPGTAPPTQRVRTLAGMRRARITRGWCVWLGGAAAIAGAGTCRCDGAQCNRGVGTSRRASAGNARSAGATAIGTSATTPASSRAQRHRARGQRLEALVHREQCAGQGWHAGVVGRRGVAVEVRQRPGLDAHADRAALGRHQRSGIGRSDLRLEAARAAAGLCVGVAGRRHRWLVVDRVRGVQVVRLARCRDGAGHQRGADRRHVCAGGAAGFAHVGGAGRAGRFSCADLVVYRQRQSCRAVFVLRRAQRRHRGDCMDTPMARAEPAGVCFHLRHRHRVGCAAVHPGEIRHDRAVPVAVLRDVCGDSGPACAPRRRQCRQAHRWQPVVRNAAGGLRVAGATA